MTDVLNAKITPDKASYVYGNLITLTLSGDDLETTPTTMNVLIEVANSVTGAILGSAKVALAITEAVDIGIVMKSITDDLNIAPWVIAANGLTATCQLPKLPTS